MKQYKTVVSGGTFDHFHKGHEAFLRGQLAISEMVLVGITSDRYTKERKNDGIQSLQVRMEAITQFLRVENAFERVEIAVIDENMIPSVWEERAIDGIVVTADTQKGAEHINEQRANKGKSTLPIVVLPDILAKDGLILSATRIRKGEVDREGNLWIPPSYLQRIFQLPQSLRSEMQKPLGTVWKDNEKLLEEIREEKHTLITVGDLVTETFLRNGISLHIAIVDLLVERERVFPSLAAHRLRGDEEIIALTNPAATIQPLLFKTAKEIIHDEKNYVIWIQGEEDLAVLPFVLAAPLNSHIYYGQPNEGIVGVLVTEEKKEYVRKLLEKFLF